MRVRRSSVISMLCACALACLALSFGAQPRAQADDHDGHHDKPKAPAAPKQPKCSLVEAEIPRGGRLEVAGEHLGKAPVVRIAGKAARMLERRDDRISVQVAADSDGGLVTVQTGGQSIECGTLVIIGKNK